MLCPKKIIGIICLCLGIGMFLAFIFPWFNFFTAVILVSFGIWEIIQNNF